MNKRNIYKFERVKFQQQIQTDITTLVSAVFIKMIAYYTGYNSVST